MATPTNLPAAAVSGEILTASYVNNLRGAFRVLQVVQGVANLQLDNSTQTPTTTGLTATITPQSVTNKILVLVSQVSCLKTSGNSQSATTIQQFAQFGLYTDSLVQNRGNFSTVYLDSPATTSAVTYSTQFANAVTAASVSVCAGNGAQATITLIEISA